MAHPSRSLSLVIRIRMNRCVNETEAEEEEERREVKEEEVNEKLDLRVQTHGWIGSSLTPIQGVEKEKEWREEEGDSLITIMEDETRHK